MIDDRIYIDRGLDTATAALLNNNNNTLPWLAAMNGGMGMGANGWLNNPFIYLIFLAMFGRGFGFGNNNCAENAQIAALASQMSDNQNSNLIMDGIKGNASAISTLASNLNCDFNTLNNAICGVQNAITNVAGQLGFSAERVINAVNMGDCNVIKAISDCCCNTQQSILKMGYENQLSTCQQTNALTSEMTRGFSGLNYALSTGFAQVGYANAQQTCDLLTAGNNNTQRIIDTLNNHWNQDLQQKYNDARLELSQKAQNEYLIAQLKSTGTTTTPAA